MNEVFEYLKNCGAFYLATVEGDQPRVRPFGAIDVFEDKLYIQTGKIKKVSAQMKTNPKVEICGMENNNSWIRIEASVIEDDRLEAKQHMLDANPSLKSMYAADDGNTEVLYLKDVTATIYSFTVEPKTIRF
nr:pyridoxamine 5'-phosphate oxidase family protein [Sedimentibacter sp.]